MLNKILILLLGCLLLNSSYAANSDAADAVMLTTPTTAYYLTWLKADAYAGLQLGVSLGNVRRRLNYTTFDLPAKESDYYGLSGLNAGVVLGLGAFIHDFYLGFEGTGSVTTLQREVKHNIFTFKLAQKQDFSIDFVPGFKFTKNNMFFIRIGMAHGKFKFSTNNPVEFRIHDQNRSLNGLRLGLGLNVFLTKHIAMRGEYIYTNYKTLSTTFVDTTIIPNTPYYNNFAVSTHQVDIAFIYHFSSV